MPPSDDEPLIFAGSASRALPIEPQASRLPPKLEVVSVAPLFGEAIRRIHQRESLSVLFD